MTNKRYSHLSSTGKEHFNTEKEIQKYHLDVSTFDVINVSNFRNYKCSTLFWYLYMWTLVFLSFALLATDIYSCLNILVFHRWATDNYKPYAYSVAKWIFTGCIIFQFVLLFYHWMWAIHIMRTKNIALVYLNSIAKKVYSIRRYDYFCLLNNINEGNFFDWCCFLTYYELDNALQILVADTPRQVINVLTLRYYATGGELNNNILQNIEDIAKTNLYLSIILSFMCLSVFIYAIFLFRFLFGMICYIPLKVQLKGDNYNSFKDYCCSIVNDHIETAVRLNHKPKTVLLEQGILSEERIAKLPVLGDTPPEYNDYSKTFYRTTTKDYSTKESIIPLRDIKSRSNSTPDYKLEFGNKNQEQVYSPINDQLNNIDKRLSELREKYNQQSLTYAYGETDFNRSGPQSISNYKPRNGSSSSQQSQDVFIPGQQRRANSLPYQETVGTTIGKLPKRSVTDNLEYKPRRKQPPPPLLFENVDIEEEEEQQGEANAVLDRYPIPPLEKTYMQDYHKQDFVLPQEIDGSRSLSNQSHPWQLDYPPVENPFMNSTEELSSPLVESTARNIKRTFTDQYPITEEEAQSTSKEATPDPPEAYPATDSVIDELLDKHTFTQPTQETPYPVRGVSKYFEHQ
ncbi:hypothetical protein Cantr_01177 [Candida viswanathii]|uniref:Vacuolar membrane protein n=1 Tax=Candida viswanathii TaxID=5486 RepID=A0A367YK38_9ASCO|nr:hypothetical protein Cantr_01177 [Candida viswanathii]